MKYLIICPRRGIALSALALALISFANPASAELPVPPMNWGPCGPGQVDSSWTDELGSRLECGSMVAPIDDATPALGTIDVGLVRFKAGIPAQRQGSIFFNFGGPGVSPMDGLPGTGYLWSSHSASHPVDGDKRRLADTYDLVAVVPRGLRGGTAFSCGYTHGPMFALDPALYLADWNWVGFAREARAYAGACAANPLLPHVGSLQHVRDMERARQALGEPVLNFVGVSYGTWVGAFYASTYPARAGRIVLDSVVNYASGFEEQFGSIPPERQAHFVRFALKPALARPRLFGLGTDAAAVTRRFHDMPRVAREAWATFVNTPAELAAVLTMAEWLREDANTDSEALAVRAQTHRFSADAATNEVIRRAAVTFSAAIDASREPPEDNAPVNDDVYAAVVCADTPWRKTSKELRTLASFIGSNYPAAAGMPVKLGLICSNWPAPTRQLPDISLLARAPAMLLVQAEFDPATPFRGARRALDASPGSRMVLARNARQHSLVGLSGTPCVERAVGHFLLTGELPDERLTSCEFVPATPARNARIVGGQHDADTVRARLLRLLQRS
jgi:pimeloyl-ACP methyl ester carboxylesterase